MGGYDSLIELFVIKDAYGERTFLEMPKQLVEIRGLAMPPLEHRTIRSPFQHGESYLGFSLRPRPVQIVMHVEGCDRLDMWYKRRELIQQLNPLLGRLRLQVHFRDHTIYELHDVAYDAGFDVGTDGQAGPSLQAFAARFIAFDPVWWRHPEQSVEVTLDVQEELIFPITFPIIFGGTTILEDQAVTITGSWMSFPIIVYTGPMRNPRIENLTTQESLELTYKIVNDEVVTIITRFGYKTVTNADGDNLIGYLTPNSDLATFHLDPDPIAVGGINDLRFTATECDENSAISLSWFNRYLGI